MRDAVIVGDSASDDFGMAQGIGSERQFEGHGVAWRRLDREHPPRQPDLAGERHGPLAEIGADIDDDRAGLQKAEDSRVNIWRMEQGGGREAWSGLGTVTRWPGRCSTSPPGQSVRAG